MLMRLHRQNCQFGRQYPTDLTFTLGEAAPWLCGVTTPVRRELANVDLMNIGDFARQSRLSAKALRLYDELGLLRPARVDAGGHFRTLSI
jgi:MerR family regulatory protein